MTEERVGRKRGGHEHRHLAARQRRQLGQRAFRDADSDVGHHQARERQLGDPAQRTLQSTVLEDAEGALVGNEDAVSPEVVAARSAQAGHRPRVDDLDIGGVQDHHAQGRDTTIVDQAVADELFGVLAPAGERPLARDEVPAVDGCGGARRIERSRADHVRRFGVDRVERLRSGAARR